MADATSIEWCDATFNPWFGCTKVSRTFTGGGGCDNCYAEMSTPARVLRANGEETWGPGAPRKRTSPANWKRPIAWNARAFFECAECSNPGCTWRGEDDESCGACGGHVVPTRRRVFCASLADVFDNEVPDEWRQDLFRLIESTPNLDWLLLTKRIGNASDMMFRARGGHLPLLANVWLGATIVNQEEADRDIPKLLATPARVRFLSMEPLLGPVDLSSHLWGRAQPCSWCPKDADCECGFHPRANIDGEPALSWVITGGESGPKARPAHPDWFRSLRDQCKASGVPFLFKQWGEWASTWHARIDPALAEGKPYVHVTPMCRENGTNTSAPNYQLDRVGKKAAGRLLDGVEHNGFPKAAV